MKHSSVLFTAAFVVAASTAAPVIAEPAPFKPIEGQHYRLVAPPALTEVKPGQIEVIEFYSLGCPHCAEIEPYVQSWLKRKPANVAFKRVPATFNPFFRMLARVHYALEDIGATERIAPQLFEALHVRPDPALTRPFGEWQNKQQRGQEAAALEAEKVCYEALASWVAARGADGKKFTAALNSPSMMVRLGRADATYRRYGVLGVPGMSVNGKYFTAAGRPLGLKSYAELMATVDGLVAIEAKTAR